MIEIDPGTVHARTVEVLGKSGFHVPHAPTLDKLARAGLPVDREAGVVRMQEAAIVEALRSLPKNPGLFSRDGKQRLPLGERPAFKVSGKGSTVYDLDTGIRRPSTVRDIEQFVKLQDALSCVDITGPMVGASDKTTDTYLWEGLTTWLNTTKHPTFHSDDPRDVEDLLEVAIAEVGGEAALRKTPPFSTVFCPISPLGLSFDVECMLRFAEAGIPVLALTMSMGGASSPATLTGQLILANAEVLGTAVIVQMLHPGTPVIYGSVSSVLDMRTGILALGALERPLLGLGSAAMARFYGMPSCIGGISTDGKQFDEQIGFEKCLTALPLVGQADIIMGLGNMASASTYSLEQLVLDNEFALALTKIGKGIQVGDGVEETRLINEVGPGGNFLSHDHTLAHYKSYWHPEILSRESHDTWEAAGQPLMDKVRDRVRSILNEHPVPPLSPAGQEAFDRILKRRNLQYEQAR